MKIEELDLKKLVESKTFCILPWIHLHVLPDSSVTPCCIYPYDDIYGNGRQNTLYEIWNSRKFRELRLRMLSGEFSHGCQRCYRLEESGFESMRKQYLQSHFHCLEKILDTRQDGHIEDVNFNYIDVRFSNLCNFKCRGCGPALSSAWFDDHQELYSYKSNLPKVLSISQDAPSFWNDIKPHFLKADRIYFGGGEPLITREHFEILKKLYEEKRFDTVLTYNTNLSQLQYGDHGLDYLWSEFKCVSLGISLDDIHKRAEYFRHGTKWSVIEKNMLHLKEKYPNIILYVNCTVNIMNVYYLPEIFNYLVDKNIVCYKDININMLLDPDELSIQALSTQLREAVKNKLKTFQKELYSLGNKAARLALDIGRIISFMEEKDSSDLLPLFKEKVQKLDTIRNESFTETFPELVSLLDE